MALLKFSNVGIAGISAAVPVNKIYNFEYTDYFSKEEVKQIVEKVGIFERRFAPEGMCSSDLCFAAAEKLISDMDIDKSDIGLLVFISQTPDYRMPATSILLQNKLGLSKNTAAFDLTLGCSGFVYGLSIVYGLIQSGMIKKALLLDGETRSRIYSPKDRKTAFIFGDGGIAAIIENDKKFGDSFFSLNSDGSKESYIKIESGGYRNPSCPSSTIEKVVDEYGNIRHEEHGFMNGADVFNFVISEIPNDLKVLYEFSGVTKDEIDYFIFHQANSYMNNYLVKKLNLDKTKVPTCIESFGNTSSVSIPLTIASRLQDSLNSDKKKLLLSGFGVGMSWATAVINTENCYVSDMVEI